MWKFLSLVPLSFFQTLLCIGHSYECFYRVNSSTSTSFTQVDIKYKEVTCSCLAELSLQVGQGSPPALITEREQLHKHCVSSRGILEMSCVLVFTFHQWRDSPAWSANSVNWYLLTRAEMFILCPSSAPFLGCAEMSILITIQLEISKLG